MSPDNESKKPLILIVDDNKDVILSYTDLFQEIHGFEVRSASTKVDAIRLVETLTGPAVLILDRWLHDYEGNSIFGENLLIEMNYRSRFTIITIMLSGDSSLTSQLNAIKAGAYWYFLKGGSTELFMAYVWQAVSVVKLLVEPNEDPLTKALNRRAMYDRVTRELSRARRLGAVTACLMYDVDKLKLINDTYGHDVGDEVIVSVVNSIREHIRPTDLVCRYGGDEILTFLFDVDEGWLDSFAESSYRAISEKKIAVTAINGSKESKEFISVSASLGWKVLSPEEIEEAFERETRDGVFETFEQRKNLVLRGLVEDLIKQADREMYIHKASNR